jgi:hypothetical protein
MKPNVRVELLTFLFRFREARVQFSARRSAILTEGQFSSSPPGKFEVVSIPVSFSGRPSTIFGAQIGYTH